MEFLSDILLGLGAVFASVYCFVLSRKLSKLKGLDQDLGSAIAIMSRQVDEMTEVLTSAQETAGESAQKLAEKTEAAARVSDRLELMIAALQDLPEDDGIIQTASPPPENPEVTPPPPAAPLPDDVNVFVRTATRRAS